MAFALPRSCAAGLFATLLVAGCSGKTNPNALRQHLTAQIPLRSTPAQVLAFLTAQKIAHSPYHRTETAGYSIEAEMAVPAPRSLVQPTYDVVFEFDDHGLLKSYDVQYLGYVGL
jgi:hypothetical protein